MVDLFPIFNYLLNTPKATIPQWIAAFGTIISLPVATWSIVKLFIKDKAQEQKLKFIEDQLEEFKKQTAQFALQTELMREANELQEKYIKWQTENFLQIQSKEDARSEYEKQKHKNSIKPRFIFNTSMGNSTEFKLKLMNKGGNAQNVQFKSIDTDKITIRTFKENYNIDTDQFLEITGVSNANSGFFNISALSCKITILFADIDDNKYVQELTKIGGNVEVANPKEVNEL